MAPLINNNDAVTKKHLTDSLKVKAGTNYVSQELAKKANKTDVSKLLDDYVLKSSLPSNDALAHYAVETKHYITVWAEESGNLTQGNLEWSFGNGTENNSKYGWPSPADGK